MKDLIPLSFKWWRNLPTQLIIPQPHTDQMSGVRLIVLVWLSRVKKCEVIDESHVARLYRGLDANLPCSKVESIKGLGLSF